MELIIDAHVICGYFKEEVLNIDHQMTDNPSLVIDRILLDKLDKVFLDDGKIIENEWRNLVGREWFDTWLADLFRDGYAYEVSVNMCQDIRRNLHSLGFPVIGREGKDIWYIRTARAVIGLKAEGNQNSSVYIISEDLHFFDPTRKHRARGEERLRILCSNEGPVSKYLEQIEGMRVRCIISYIKEIKMINVY